MCDQDIIVHTVTMHFLSEGVVGLPLDSLSTYEPIIAEGIPPAVKAIAHISNGGFHGRDFKISHYNGFWVGSDTLPTKLISKGFLASFDGSKIY